MNKIEKLIEELCPEGVPIRPLREVCLDFLVPMRDRPQTFDGNIPWCRIEDIRGHNLSTSHIGLYVSDAIIKSMNLKVFPEGTVVASCSASLGTYAIAQVPLVTNQTFIGLVCGPELLNKYLLYLLEISTERLALASNSGTIPYISRKKFEDFTIPVPPLKVQREIVSILDKFTELEAELEAELEVRISQLNHIRRELLNPEGSEKDMIKLGDLVSVLSNVNKVPKERYLSEGIIPIIDQSQKFVSGYSDNKDLANKTLPCIVFGDHTRAIKYVDFPFVPGADGVKIVVPTEPKSLNVKFLFHAMTILDIPNLGYSRHWSVVKESAIWVPDITEQIRVTSILDRVQSLSHDASFGLPAEIVARRQQYEYYRNKLLTFKELKAS